MTNEQLIDYLTLLDNETRKAIEIIVENCVRAADPDYTRLTENERKELEKALREDDYQN